MSPPWKCPYSPWWRVYMFYTTCWCGRPMNSLPLPQIEVWEDEETHLGDLESCLPSGVGIPGCWYDGGKKLYRVLARLGLLWGCSRWSWRAACVQKTNCFKNGSSYIEENELCDVIVSGSRELGKIKWQIFNDLGSKLMKGTKKCTQNTMSILYPVCLSECTVRISLGLILSLHNHAKKHMRLMTNYNLCSINTFLKT